MQDSGQATPIIIGGTGRSGTRQLADILALHPQVHIHGEIAPGLQDRFLKLADAKELNANRAPKEDARWQMDKVQFVYDSWAVLSKRASPGPTNTSFLGQKTPSNERFFRRYEQFFESTTVRPIYYYCGRDFIGTWKSFKMMPWNPHGSVEAFAEKYIDSWSYFEDMYSDFPERTRLFNLPLFAAVQDKVDFCAEYIYRPLGLSVDDQMAARIMNSQNRNSSSNSVGAEPKELDAAEIAFAARTDGIQEIHRKHFEFVNN